MGIFAVVDNTLFAPAFTAPPLVTISGVQYATYGNSGYNMLRGPYYQSWDMNLEKNIRFPSMGLLVTYLGKLQIK